MACVLCNNGMISSSQMRIVGDDDTRSCHNE